MSAILTNDQWYNDIANAIRAKLQAPNATYFPKEMAGAINEIDSFTIPIDPESSFTVTFGCDNSGFYISDTMSDKTELSFGKDQIGIYVSMKEDDGV